MKGLLAPTLLLFGVSAASPAGLPAFAGAGLPPVCPLAMDVRPTGPYATNILEQAATNRAYRRVVFTGAQSQLTVMSIAPGEAIGQETHATVEQLLFVVSGEGRTTLDGKARYVGPGDVIVVPAGTEHDVAATGDAPLQLYTVYVPPYHIDGRVHETRAAAESDAQDELFGICVDRSASGARDRASTPTPETGATSNPPL